MTGVQTCALPILKGEGIEDIAAWVAARMPQGPWLYPEDQVADIPSRLLAAEITREKLYLRLHDELPYASAVMTESWKEQKDGSVLVSFTAGGFVEMCWHLYTWGTNVEVIKPTKLRALMRAAIKHNNFDLERP